MGYEIQLLDYRTELKKVKDESSFDGSNFYSNNFYHNNYYLYPGYRSLKVNGAFSTSSGKEFIVPNIKIVNGDTRLVLDPWLTYKEDTSYTFVNDYNRDCYPLFIQPGSPVYQADSVSIGTGMFYPDNKYGYSYIMREGTNFNVTESGYKTVTIESTGTKIEIKSTKYDDTVDTFEKWASDFPDHAIPLNLLIELQAAGGGSSGGQKLGGGSSGSGGGGGAYIALILNLNDYYWKIHLGKAGAGGEAEGNGYSALDSSIQYQKRGGSSSAYSTLCYIQGGSRGVYQGSGGAGGVVKNSSYSTISITNGWLTDSDGHNAAYVLSTNEGGNGGAENSAGTGTSKITLHTSHQSSNRGNFSGGTTTAKIGGGGASSFHSGANALNNANGQRGYYGSGASGGCNWAFTGYPGADGGKAVLIIHTNLFN